MANIIAIAVLALIVGGAALYIHKARKKGAKCIGCPYAQSCGKNGASCGGCSGEKK